MIGRRGFLAGMLALGAAPGIVTSKGVRAAFEPSSLSLLIRGEIGQIDRFVIVVSDYLDPFIDQGRVADWERLRNARMRQMMDNIALAANPPQYMVVPPIVDRVVVEMFGGGGGGGTRL
jgi:hypothetical protein